MPNQATLPGLALSETVPVDELFKAWQQVPNRPRDFARALHNEPVRKCLAIMASLNHTGKRRRKHAAR